MKNISKEDYLSVIFKHIDSNMEIKSNVIAQELSISNSAVTDMLKKLSNEKLINYKPYKPITLTAKGENYARNMVRRHRIWEMFLHKFVGLSWEKIHKEAEKLEHSGSDELINKMEEVLNFPKYDPHGAPIPNKFGSFPKERKLVPLSEISQGNKAIVMRVTDYDDEFLKYISEIGLKLNTELKVKEKRLFDNSIKIIVSKKEINISNKTADNIFVKVISAKSK